MASFKAQLASILRLDRQLPLHHLLYLLVLPWQANPLGLPGTVPEHSVRYVLEEMLLVCAV